MVHARLSIEEAMLTACEQPPAIFADIAIVVEDDLVDPLRADLDFTCAVDLSTGVVRAFDVDEVVGDVQQAQPKLREPPLEVSLNPMPIDCRHPRRRISSRPQGQHEGAVAARERVRVAKGELPDLLDCEQSLHIGGGRRRLRPPRIRLCRPHTCRIGPCWIGS